MKQVQTLRPTPLIKKAEFSDFEQFGSVRMPDESESPILPMVTRHALSQWLAELNQAEALAAVGVKPRQSVMLGGPPGTGKTTLAWHVSARLGLPLVVIEVSSLVAPFIGSTGANIGKLFSLARKTKGQVALFFDEIDAIATKRGEDGGRASKERDNTVIALLQMMDGYDDGLVFAATNRPEQIDAAVWRRFKMQITVGMPGEDERFAIIKRYLQPFALDEEAIFGLGEVLDGASPALLREVCEAVKRDLVLGPKLKHDMTAPSVFDRIRSTMRPADDMPQPPLWNEEVDALDYLKGLSWPPRRD